MMARLRMRRTARRTFSLLVVTAGFAMPRMAQAWNGTIALAAGVEQIDAHFRDYGWDAGSHPSWNLSTALRHGRFGILAGFSRTETAQHQDIGVEPARQDVALSNARLMLEARLFETHGVALRGRAGAGRLHIGYEPDRAALTGFNAGTAGEIAFEPIDAWSGELGVAVAVALTRALSLEIAAERRTFRIDTSHRDGESIVRGEESFANGSLTGGLHWELWRAPGSQDAKP
jgi:hypothetical protein